MKLENGSGFGVPELRGWAWWNGSLWLLNNDEDENEEEEENWNLSTEENV